MESVERILVNGFFPAFLYIAQVFGVLGIVYFISDFFSSMYMWQTPYLFAVILLAGKVLYIILRGRALTSRIKKLLESEAANIALAGNAQSGLNQEAHDVIERRVYKKLCAEGLAVESEKGNSPAISKKIADAILQKYNHLKGIH